MNNKFFSFLKQNIWVAASLALIITGTTIYFVLNQLQHVEAKYDSVLVSETHTKDINPDTVRFSIILEQSNKNEQQLYNAILSQTDNVISILFDAGIEPMEYEIEQQVIQPKGKEKKFKMIQKVHIESSHIESAEKVYKKVQKIKNLSFEKLQYGVSDLRPFEFDLNNEALSNAQTKAKQQIESAGNEFVGLKSINGLSDIHLFNPSPNELEDETKQKPFFTEVNDDKPSFEAKLPILTTVKAEYFFN